MARKQYPEAGCDIRQQGSTSIVTISGEIDMSRSPSIHQQLVEALQARPARLIFDLTNVGYMDSSGVGVLVDALRRMRLHGGRLALVAVAPRVLSVLQITKLDQFFEMYATLQEALEK